MMSTRRERRFCAFFWFVGWDCISLGAHVSLMCPNIELHVPFGFFKLGWDYHYPDTIYLNAKETNERVFGWGGRV